MATIERILLSLGGFLSVGRESSAQRATYKRTLTRVSLTTKGANPAASNIGIKIRLDSVEQSTEYLLPAGLKYADNTSTLVVSANVNVDFIITTAPTDPTPVDLDVWLEYNVGFEAVGQDTTDCGLGTLGELKRFCITSSLDGASTFNEAMIAIGRGTAKAFDVAVGRKLKRETGAVEQFVASRKNMVLAHTPVESVTKLELKYDETEGWVDMTSGIASCLLNNLDGILTVPSDFWPLSAQFRHDVPGLWRVTLTGGYWYDPTDDGSGTKPTGATELPNDLKLAWLLQCQHLWVNRDNLGITWSPTGESRDTRKSLANVKFIPLVTQTLNDYSNPVNLR